MTDLTGVIVFQVSIDLAPTLSWSANLINKWSLRSRQALQRKYIWNHNWLWLNEIHSTNHIFYRNQGIIVSLDKFVFVMFSSKWVAIGKQCKHQNQQIQQYQSSFKKCVCRADSNKKMKNLQCVLTQKNILIYTNITKTPPWDTLHQMGNIESAFEWKKSVILKFTKIRVHKYQILVSRFPFYPSPCHLIHLLVHLLVHHLVYLLVHPLLHLFVHLYVHHHLHLGDDKVDDDQGAPISDRISVVRSFAASFTTSKCRR